MNKNTKILALNKKAKMDFEILETYEAGIKLTGAEVKSAKQGQINLKGSYATIGSNFAPVLVGAHIAKYKPASGSQIGYDSERSRELLLNKKEINSLFGKLKEKRYSLLPLAVTSKAGIIKIELGLGRGKKKYEKREDIKKRETDKEIRSRQLY
jgi:SsrA-binding protein